MKYQKKKLVAALLSLSSISAVAANYEVSLSTDDGSGLTADTLSWAILQANTSQGADVITLSSDIEITGVMKRIIDSDVTIQSDSIKRTISGGGLYRPLFIKSGEVIIQDLNIIDSRAKGGDSDTGGGGGGLGGALFVYDGNVIINDVTISGSTAIGGVSTGIAGTFNTSGGGMYGNGTSRGGGLFGTPYGGYGNYQGNNNTFGQGGYVNPPSNYYGSKGGFSGGGSDGYYGGYSGGFGGGGGAGSGNPSPYNLPGRGGFGGGSGQSGGYPYGSFSRPSEDGDGMGGAIFVRSGQLNLSNVTLLNNSATSAREAGLGGGLFVLHTLEDTPGSQGMPGQLPVVNACKLDMINNHASTDAGTVNNNDNFFDTADLINADSGLQPTAACLIVSGNNQLILSEDTTPNTADNTDFGIFELDNPVAITQTFSLRNFGLNDIGPVVSISGSGSPDFQVSSQPNASSSASFSDTPFEVTFYPQTEGVKTATLEISIDEESAYNFAIRGQSIYQAAEIEIRSNGQTIDDNQITVSTIDNTQFLAPVSNNAPDTHQFKAHNLGNLDLELIGQPIINIMGQDFDDFEVTLQPTLSTIDPVSSETFDITFDPAEPGLKMATIEVINSDSNEPVYDFTISGVALAPDIEIKDEIPFISGEIRALEFDATRAPYNWLDNEALTISNTGDYVLNFDTPTAFEITGIHSEDFQLYVYSIDGLPRGESVFDPGYLEINEKGNLTIQFNPGNLGYREALLHVFTDSFNDNHFIIPLKGLGYAFFEETLPIGASNQVAEGQDILFNIRLDVLGQNNPIPYDADITFNYQLSGDVNEADFNGLSLQGNLTFLADQLITTITIPTVEDFSLEGNELVTLTLNSTSPFFNQDELEYSFVIIDSDVIFSDGFE